MDDNSTSKTGAAIRSSWMKKLNEELAVDASPSSPLSVDTLVHTDQIISSIARGKANLRKMKVLTD